MSEYRMRPWLDSPPEGFLERAARTKSQTMYMIRHSIGWTKDVPKISFEVIGSTGSIYETVIGKVPTCDCPDVKFRKVQCKHICFVLYAMDVPEKLMYQRAFLPSELREMLAALSLKRNLDTTTLTSTCERKLIEGECPICFHDFETNRKTTWCRSCGSNFHVACFRKWERTLHDSCDVVHCLYCKAPCKGDEYGTPQLTAEAARAKELRTPGKYVNVGDE